MQNLAERYQGHFALATHLESKLRSARSLILKFLPDGLVFQLVATLSSEETIISQKFLFSLAVLDLLTYLYNGPANLDHPEMS